MRRTSLFLPLFAMIAGIAGFFLRKTELDTVFDSVTGLAEKGTPVTISLIALSILFAAVSILLSVLISRNFEAKPKYEHAFGSTGLFYLGAFVILGLAVICGSVLYFLGTRSTGVQFLDLVFTVFGIFSGISLIILARGAYKGSGGSEMCLFSVIPPVFFCIWLIITYKEHAPDPVILDYAYISLAIASTALGYYYAAGFVYHKAKPGKTIFSYLLTIYFCLVTLADQQQASFSVLLAAVIFASLINMGVFVKNLAKKTPKP